MKLNCNCQHPFQEENYGNQRIFNMKGSGLSARCTVCGREVPLKSTSVSNKDTTKKTKST